MKALIPGYSSAPTTSTGAGPCIAQARLLQLLTGTI